MNIIINIEGTTIAAIASFILVIGTLFICINNAHKQYMIGHDTWMYKHTTTLEKTLQENKLKGIYK